jgi:uncharacterized membrane protein (DUF2068 family)
MSTERPSAAGLRTVAALEAAKGALVMVAGLGLVSLLHRDSQQAAESIVRHLHLNPAREFPRIFIEAATHVTDARLWLLASGAFTYAVARGVEAYGLWRGRAWAEWFAIVSGAIYLPIEIFELVRHATALKAAIVLVNAAIVAYICYVRMVKTSE